MAPRAHEPTRCPGRRLRAALLSVALLGLCACASEPLSPEEQVRAVIAQAESAAEQKDLDALKTLIAEHYHDERGNSKQGLTGLANLYFLQNRSIHLLTRIDTLSLADSMQAQASILVAMAGQPMADASILSLARAALYRFDFTLVDEGKGEWKVTRAAWQRATSEDFF